MWINDIMNAAIWQYEMMLISYSVTWPSKFVNNTINIYIVKVSTLNELI